MGKSKAFKHIGFKPIYDSVHQSWGNQKQPSTVNLTPYTTHTTKIGETKSKNDLQTRTYLQPITVQEDKKLEGVMNKRSPVKFTKISNPTRQTFIMNLAEDVIVSLGLQCNKPRTKSSPGTNLYA